MKNKTERIDEVLVCEWESYKFDLKEKIIEKLDKMKENELSEIWMYIEDMNLKKLDDVLF